MQCLYSKLYHLLIAVTILVLGLAAPAHAQGVYVEEGIDVGAGLSSYDGGTSIGIGAGYVYNGTFEGGLTIGRSRTKEADFNSVSFAPFIGFYPIRQSEDLPVSARLGARYAFHSYSGDAVDDLEDFGIEVSGSSYSLGGSVFHTLEATPKLDVVPLIRLSYTGTRFRAERDGESETNSDSYVSFGLGAGFAFTVSPTGLFKIYPSISRSEGENSLGIEVGYVFAR